MAREQTAIEFLRSKNHEIFKQRFKTPFAEVDILSQDPEGVLHLFEVKGHVREGIPVISHRQKLRLARALEYLIWKTGRNVRAGLLLVNDSVSPPKVEVLEEFL